MFIKTIKFKKIYITVIIFIIIFSILSVSVFTFANSTYQFIWSKDNTNIKLPIIMYHSILKSKAGNYIIHPDQFENDLIYIKKHGYTTITMTDLINYVYDDTPLPSKPIIITFDDGYFNNLGYVLPLLQKYDMKAVISIVGSYTDAFSESAEANLNYGYLRWEDINNMINDGHIEFQNHTYNLHCNTKGRNGCMKKYYEDTNNYKNLLISDINKLQNEFKAQTGYVPNTFTYPFGAISKESTEILKELGFKASLGCSKGINTISKDPNCLFLLKRNNRVNNISTEKFFKKLLDN